SFRALERHMLPEVRNALVINVFVPTSDIDNNAAMGDFGRVQLLMHDTYPIGQFKYSDISHSRAKLTDIKRFLCRNPARTGWTALPVEQSKLGGYSGRTGYQRANRPPTNQQTN